VVVRVVAVVLSLAVFQSALWFEGTQPAGDFRRPRLNTTGPAKVSTSSKMGGRILGVAMRRFASIVAILLLLTAAAPVMACLTSVVMSHEESACCRSMHGQCGQMEKMGCCRTEVRTGEAPQIAATSPATDVHWICVAHLPVLSTPVHFVASAVWLMPDEHSPPGLVTTKTTVLRI
jgi:hypothetical protein